MNLDSNEWRKEIEYSIPGGWWIRFGEQMCDEIENCLKGLPAGAIKNFQILEVKEKFGRIRIYTNWETKELKDVIRKYEDLSIRTCIACGAPATKISTSWIGGWCDEHAEPGDIPINQYLVDSIKEV